ncbi:MAG: hypothetical protein ACO3QD_04350 [Ilumatobacteraceae bacterium]|jgi:hypothetical protein
MAKRAARIARGAEQKSGVSTNLALVRGRLVALPTVRVIDRHQRATTFDVATVVNGRRAVVPVVALNMDLPIIKVGDVVTAFGHVRRRFFRVGARTQSVTELLAEQIAPGGKSQRLEKLFTEASARQRELRTASLN